MTSGIAELSFSETVLAASVEVNELGFQRVPRRSSPDAFVYNPDNFYFFDLEASTTASSTEDSTIVLDILAQRLK
jgi:hypothetical protein